MKRSLHVCMGLLLSGCVVGPDYRQPELPSNEGWSEAADESGRISSERAELARWWTAFGDPTLDSLVERAMDANLDLQAAAARVREARALAGQTRADLLPQIDSSGSATRNRFSENGVLPVPGDPETDTYTAGFDAAWELDLFGGTRRSLEAAEADIDASLEDQRAVLVSLLGEVARAYVDLRGSQRRSAVVRSNIAAAQSTLDLTNARLRAGLATELDVARAAALLAGAEAPLALSEAAARVEVHRLGVLLGVQPGDLAAELETEAPIPAPPERILVGLPSELLERRPDVRRAERQLAAATARIGAAVADRYPRFSLTGAFGLQSASSADFADAASRAWSLGPSVRWPVFSGGRITANIEVQDARAEQALVAYRQSFLTALEDVENALVNYLREWDHRRSLEAAAAAGRKSVALADDLYRKGLTDFLDVLDAERALYDAELDLAESEAASSLNMVALYKALDGGWESEG
jgi:multidrug efflux system outer membrane protein